MGHDTKQRMIESAAELLRSKGLSGMSFTDVTERSGAARGVIYHHFPDGKAELARDVVEWTGRQVRGHLQALGGATPIEVVDRYLEVIRPVVRDSVRGSSCAVAAVTVESVASDGSLADAAAGAFGSWIDALADALVALDVDRSTAVDVASQLVVLLEGAHVLCRASGSLDAFDRAARVTRAGAAALLATSSPSV